MEIFNIFEELNQLSENYNGTYKSTYLNLTDAERQESAKKYRDFLLFEHRITERGDIVKQYGGGGHGKTVKSLIYILDYESFHKAYDADLVKLNLLSCFEADGTLGPKATWGNILQIQKGSPESNIEGYKRLVELWGLIHGKSWGKLFDVNYNEDSMDLKRKCLKTKAEVERLAQSYKQQHQTSLKSEEVDKETLLIALNQALDDALQQLDPQIISNFQEYHNDSTLVPELVIEKDSKLYHVGGDIVYHIYLDLHDLGKKQIYLNEDTLSKYTADYFLEILEESLDLEKLNNKIAARRCGLEAIDELVTARKNMYTNKLLCYFINLDTNELYRCENSATVLNSKGEVVTQQELEQTALIFAYYLIPEYGFMRHYTAGLYGMEASYLMKGYFSWASDFEDLPEVARLLPGFTDEMPSATNKFRGKFGDAEEYSSATHPNMKKYGVQYEGIDRWALSNIVEVHCLSSGTEKALSQQHNWDSVTQQISHESTYNKDWDIKLE